MCSQGHRVDKVEHASSKGSLFYEDLDENDQAREPEEDEVYHSLNINLSSADVLIDPAKGHCLEDDDHSTYSFNYSCKK